VTPWRENDIFGVRHTNRGQTKYGSIGLNLKLEDLEEYESPLVGFDGRMVIPHEMIKLPMQAGMRRWKLALLWWKLIPCILLF